jgi:hypothetical protein
MGNEQGKPAEVAPATGGIGELSGVGQKLPMTMQQTFARGVQYNSMIGIVHVELRNGGNKITCSHEPSSQSSENRDPRRQQYGQERVTEAVARYVPLSQLFHKETTN